MPATTHLQTTRISMKKVLVVTCGRKDFQFIALSKAEDKAIRLAKVSFRNLPGMRSKPTEDRTVAILNQQERLAGPSLALSEESANGYPMYFRAVQQPPKAGHSALHWQLTTQLSQPHLVQQTALAFA